MAEIQKTQPNTTRWFSSVWTSFTHAITRPGVMVVWAGVMVLAMFAALALLARLPFFWTISKIQRMLVVFGVGLVLFVPLLVLQRAGWQALLTRAGRWKLAWLALALAAGAGAAVSGWLPPAFLINPHHLIIEVVPGENQPGDHPIRIAQIRGVDGNPLLFEQFSGVGQWQPSGTGIVLQGSQAARLETTFNSLDGSIQVFMENQPGGGIVNITADGKNYQIRSDGLNPAPPLSLPVRVIRRMGQLIQAADWLAVFGVTLLLVLAALGFLFRPASQPLTWARIRRSQYEVVFLAVFVGLLLLPLQNWAYTPKELDRKFWNREALLRGWGNFRLSVLGDRIFESVMADHQGWLMYSGDVSLDDYQNNLTLTPQQLENVRIYLDQANDYLAQQGIRFVVVVPPNKNTIYPEHMPPEIKRINQTSVIDQIVDYQRLNGTTQVIDLRPALIEGRKTHEVYFATDTHWNPYGIWIGYNQILSSMQDQFPTLAPHPLTDFVYTPTQYRNGDMGAVLGQIDVYEQYFDLIPKFERQYTEVNYKADAVMMRTTTLPDANLPRMVMYHDSFTVGLMPYLSNHFSRATYVWTGQVDKALIKAEDPDIVILEITERYLTIFLLNGFMK